VARAQPGSERDTQGLLYVHGVGSGGGLNVDGVVEALNVHGVVEASVLLSSVSRCLSLSLLKVLPCSHMHQTPTAHTLDTHQTHTRHTPDTHQTDGRQTAARLFDYCYPKLQNTYLHLQNMGRGEKNRQQIESGSDSEVESDARRGSRRGSLR